MQSMYSQSEDVSTKEVKVIDYEASINHLIEKGELTHEQYQAYTSHYCWYCGREFTSSQERHVREHDMYKRERTAKFLRTLITTYSRSIPIPLCSECNEYHRVADVSKKYFSVFAHVIAYGIFIFPLILCFKHFWGEEGLGVVSIALVLLAVALHRILYPLTVLLITPFRLLYCRIRRGKLSKQLRKENDVPLVKQAKREGFRHPLIYW